MEKCQRCGIEKDGVNDLCHTCLDEFEQETQESMSQMFDADGNNR